MEPVVLYDGKILDGRNRYRACVQAGVVCKFQTYNGSDPVSVVVSLNLRRRHLTASQRSMVAARLARLGRGRRWKKTGVSTEQAAALVNVSAGSVEHARVVRDHAVRDLVRAVEVGKVAVSTASTIARLPHQEQQTIVIRGEREIIKAARQIYLARSEARAELNSKISRRPVRLPDRKFRVIVVDPAWPYRGSLDPRAGYKALEYPTMDERALYGLGQTIDSVAADDCHLFCWTRQRFLPLTFKMLESWGCWTYGFTMIWRKGGGPQPPNSPQFNAEFVVYAKRGNPNFIDRKRFAVCFDGPRREHSRKPDEFYDLVKRVTGGPRVDMFSREPRDGFARHGNEVRKFRGAA